MKRFIKLILKYPLIAANYIYSYFYYKNKQIGENYNIDDMLVGGKKVLVLAPHVDDETIGLGSTLFRHRDLGNQMALVYMTDGGGSQGHLSREDLLAARKSEGQEVGEAYGFQNLYFLDQPDGELDPDQAGLRERLLAIIDQEKPDIIYTPFLLDGHVDHVATSRLLIKVLESWDKTFDGIYMYEVNLPIWPGLVNSICKMDKEDYDKKSRVYNIFSSQWLMGFDVFRLLDRRKKLLLGSGYGAEVFVKADLAAMVEMWEALEKEGFMPQEFRQISSHYNLLLAFSHNRKLRKAYFERLKEIMTRREKERIEDYVKL